jgi:hypothetical protein
MTKSQKQYLALVIKEAVRKGFQEAREPQNLAPVAPKRPQYREDEYSFGKQMQRFREYHGRNPSGEEMFAML